MASTNAFIVPISDTCTIMRRYPIDDPIWKLEEEKRVRKAIADVQRELIQWSDLAVHKPVTVRG